MSHLASEEEYHEAIREGLVDPINEKASDEEYEFNRDDGALFEQEWEKEFEDVRDRIQDVLNKSGLM